MSAGIASRLDAALQYASHRVPVFQVWQAEAGRCGCGVRACLSPGKHPLAATAPQGFKDATVDPDVLRGWFALQPDANLAEATGVYSAVLDVDAAKGGWDTLAAFEGQHERLPRTPTVHTGGGGGHYRFRPVPELRCSTGVVGPGLDIRAEGGYAILPPSNHVSGGVYREDPDAPLFETPLAPMPAWVLALAMGSGGESGRGGGSNGHRASPDGWGERLQGAPVGQRRAVALQIAGHYLGLRIASEEVLAILLGFAERCAPPFPAAEARAIVEDLARRDHRRNASAPPREDPSIVVDPATWAAPEPVPSGLPPVPVFDAGRLLPVALREWVADIAERSQCPVDYVAVGAIVALASVIGRSVTIRPKRHDDWTVVPNLWGGAVGPPGVMKTAALAEAQRPLARLVAEAREQHRERMKAHDFEVARAKVAKELLQARIKEALKRGGDVEQLRAEFDTLDVEAPTERRYVVNDATVEKLGALLNENPRGLLHSRDEQTGWLRYMDREGHENDRAFYCEAWNGSGAYIYDRIGRGTLYIEAACVSILGGIQPGPLHGYLREAFGGEKDDGLIQRFQLMVWPDVARGWRNVDRYPETAAKSRAFAVFARLANMGPEDVGAHRDREGEDSLPFLRFDPEGQEVFDNWRAALELKLRAPDEHPVVVAHLAKYRSLMPSLALIVHLADGSVGPVSAAAAECAVAWCEYLEPHARRVYASVTAGARIAAGHLGGKISGGKLPTPFTGRQVRLKGWAGLSDNQDIRDGLDVLEELHWLRRVDVPSTVRGGRPSVEYLINPGIPRGGGS